jgi:hypothetical protein
LLFAAPAQSAAILGLKPKPAQDVRPAMRLSDYHIFSLIPSRGSHQFHRITSEESSQHGDLDNEPENRICF